MDDRLLLVKSITLLYNESLIKEKTEHSGELVRKVVNNIKLPEISLSIGTERDILASLRTTAIDMCNNPIDYEYDLLDIKQRIKLNTMGDDKLYEAIIQGFDGTSSEASLKRRITNTRKRLLSFFNEQKSIEIFQNALRTLRDKKHSVKNVSEFLTQVITQLEPLKDVSDVRDSAIIDEVDINDDDSVHKIFNDVKNNNNGNNIYKTGWKGLNRMTQGGLRPGLTVINALQSKYKSGSSLSIFRQIVRYNVPTLIDPNKKPLALRISFEDEMKDNMQFLYQAIKYNETKEYVSVSDATSEYMTQYVKESLHSNGFYVKMIRVNPTMWTYKNIFDKVMEYESQGYEVKILMLDYLAKVPTIGCITTTIGSDMCDMFTRIRNFALSKGICAITPHQLSTEAKRMLRTGIPEERFVKELPGKGFYEKTQALDQIVDLEIFQHMFRHNKKWYLAFQLGRHRLQTVLKNPDDQFCLYEFPEGMPIPDDLEDAEDISMKKLPSASNNDADALFQM